jgi:hypothetical protein
MAADRDERSILAYFQAFAPAPAWDELVSWPADVFALANLLLDHTEAYRFVVSPPPGRCWPPFADWDAEVQLAAREWRRRGGPPPLVARLWEAVTRARDVGATTIRRGEAWEPTAALLSLHAIADEACADVPSPDRRVDTSSFEARAWALLQQHGSLSRLSPTRVRIVPKANFSPRGITIRSLSRYLALCYESVDVRWRGMEHETSSDRGARNIVLVPWPLSVDAGDFRAIESSSIDLDLDRFGFFEFAPDPSLDVGLVGTLVGEAVEAAETVDAVVFPEASVHPSAFPALERTLAQHGVTFLIAGSRERPAASQPGRNYLHFGIRTERGWSQYEQDKHHRWCLDEPQIRQYHLTRSLHPKKLWWEAIDIRERTVHVIDMGSGTTVTPLVCEDLARLDEVADLVRRIGPSLVVAVLLDGPQLASRWPCRYASVITDDPGSAVLTLTSFGMVARCRPRGKPRSRVVAHWSDSVGGMREIELSPGSRAVLITTSIENETVWTADGRRHRDVPRLKLAAVRQLGRSRRPAGRAGRRARVPTGPGSRGPRPPA